MNAPSRIASCTLRTACWMKVAWRNSTSIRASGGSAVRISASAASTCAVRRVVSAPGCFCTPRITAGWPETPALPRIVWMPWPTSATSRRNTGRPPRSFTTVAPISSGLAVRPRLRTSTSRAPLVMNPPPEPPCARSTARFTSSNVTPCAAIRSGTARTCSCFRPPPIATTCEIPGIVSSRGAICQSASVRRSGGAVFPSGDDTPMSRISPISDEIGPMCTSVPDGSFASASAMRSCTSCRAR